MSLLLRHPVRIEWGDCDAAGIVFYPQFFAMFDAATHALFERALGMKHKLMQTHFDMTGLPMVDTRAKFYVPSSFGDDIIIETRIERFGRSSFDIHHRLLRDADVLGAECWETRVWMVRDKAKPGRIFGAPIPAEVITAFQGVGCSARA